MCIQLNIAVHLNGLSLLQTAVTRMALLATFDNAISCLSTLDPHYRMGIFGCRPFGRKDD